MSREARFLAVRAKVAAMEAPAMPSRAVAPFGDPAIDGVFAEGGLPLGRWHEAAGEGMEIETAAATAAFVALLATPLAAWGAVVWVMRRDDLYAPGLMGMGFPAERLIQVKVNNDTQALGAMEDALRTAGVAAAIGEAREVDLTGGRRLQLACETNGATGFIIRRRPFGGKGRRLDSGSAAATRWTITAAPSGPAQRGAVLGMAGLGAPRWRAVLERCRGGRTGGWIVEKSDGPYPLRMVADLGDRQLETPPLLRLAS